MMGRLTAAALATLLPAPGFAETSTYTELRGGACRPTGIEGAFDCAGPHGHWLRIEGAGASDSLTLLMPPRGEEEPVWPPPGPAYPNGATSIGNTVEWRLEGGAPYALILRRRLEGGRSRLEIYRIAGGRLCWVANVAGAEENLRARRAADGSRAAACR
jgi:hypothetical protein